MDMVQTKKDDRHVMNNNINVKDRERERDRQTDRQTETETERQQISNGYGSDKER